MTKKNRARRKGDLSLLVDRGDAFEDEGEADVSLFVASCLCKGGFGDDWRLGELGYGEREIRVGSRELVL